MAMLRFIGSTPGRVVRAVAGVMMITTGLTLGSRWVALAVAGIVPLAAGVFDFCLLGPLVKMPFGGEAFRERCNVA